MLEQVHLLMPVAFAKRLRHAAIFGALESLGDGEVMRFVNDHDPLPLLSQLQQRYGSQVSIAYVKREPANIVIDFTICLGAERRGPGHRCGAGRFAVVAVEAAAVPAASKRAASAHLRACRSSPSVRLPRISEMFRAARDPTRTRADRGRAHLAPKPCPADGRPW